MKALPPAPEPWKPPEQPMWVVFQLREGLERGQKKLWLAEVGRIRAGSGPAAIASVVETGRDLQDGARVAIPMDYLKPRRVRVGYFAIFED